MLPNGGHGAGAWECGYGESWLTSLETMLNLHRFDSFHVQTLGCSSLVPSKTRMLLDWFVLIESIARGRTLCQALHQTTHRYL